MPRQTARGWPIPAGLIALSLIPVGASALRLIEVASGPAVTPDNARYLAAPVVTWTHGLGGSLLLILGALQFSTPLRLRHPRWHRLAGRIAVAGGLAAALTGLWMTQTFPAGPGNPDRLYGFRMIFGLGWLLCLILGLRAAIRRDVASHRAWMMRGYAIALGAGTTVITFGLWLLAGGQDSALVTTWAITAAWLINLAVAEYLISRDTTRPAHKGATA